MQKILEQLEGRIDAITSYVERVQAETNATAIVFSSKRPTSEVLQLSVNLRHPLKVVLGSYKGKLETSYFGTIDFLPTLLSEGIIEDEESVMLIAPLNSETGTRTGYLLYNNQNVDIENIGELDILNFTKPLPNSYTFDPVDGIYFGVSNAQAETQAETTGS